MTAILVPDAQTRASLAAIRSLGRAGYAVHAASADPNALGLKSRFSTIATVHPAYDDPDFSKWMKDYVARHEIRMVVPTEGVLLALKPDFAAFKHVLPVADDPDIVFRGFSKTETARAFMNAEPALGLMKNHPASLVVKLDDLPTEKDFPKTGGGYFVKAEDARLGVTPSADVPALGFAADPGEAIVLLAQMSGHWNAALVQEACVGSQVGVSVLIAEGEAIAVSCVRDCHPEPHSNGTMSLRESCWLPEIADDTVRRLRYLGWQGCAMGEYRYDPVTKDFNLIEINFRYWQYLHLDLWAGMDFPRYQAEWFLDDKRSFDAKATFGIRCRDTWPGEVAQLINEFRRHRGSARKRIGALLLFLGRFLIPDIRQDFYFPGDRAMYFRNLYRYIRTEFDNIAGRGRADK